MRITPGHGQTLQKMASAIEELQKRQIYLEQTIAKYHNIYPHLGFTDDQTTEDDTGTAGTVHLPQMGTYGYVPIGAPYSGYVYYYSVGIWDKRSNERKWFITGETGFTYSNCVNAIKYYLEGVSGAHIVDRDPM